MTLVLVLHIIGAGTWLGCNVAQMYMGATVGNTSSEVRAWFADAGERLGKTVYSIAGVVILGTGLIMVIGDAPSGDYTFASTFVSIGLAAIIIGIVLGIVVFGPRNRALAEAVRAGNTAEESRLRRTIMQFGILDTLIVVVTIGVMVYKSGAKFG